MSALFHKAQGFHLKKWFPLKGKASTKSNGFSYGQYVYFRFALYIFKCTTVKLKDAHI